MQKGSAREQTAAQSLLNCPGVHLVDKCLTGFALGFLLRDFRFRGVVSGTFLNGTILREVDMSSR
jgi:hypothetical protein